MRRRRVKTVITAAAVAGARSERVALPLMGLVLLLPGAAACGTGGLPTACAGQCRPPYQLQVNFTAGTSHATAGKVIASCTEGNSAVIRIQLRYFPNGVGRAVIYTRVFAGAKRADQLQKCLRSSGVVATAAWPS